MPLYDYWREPGVAYLVMRLLRGGSLEDKVRAGPPDKEGWIRLELPFESLKAARAWLLGFGRAVEVLEPEALRLSVVDYVEQIVALYR